MLAMRTETRNVIRNVTKIEKQKTAARKRVAAYCRVSTDSESQLESLDNQMEAFRYQLMLHRDWDLVNIYADEGLSGTSVKGRAKFQEMIEDCEAGKIEILQATLIQSHIGVRGRKVLEISHFARIACFLNAVNDRVQRVDIFIPEFFPRGGSHFNDISCDCTPAEQNPDRS